MRTGLAGAVLLAMTLVGCAAGDSSADGGPTGSGHQTDRTENEDKDHRVNSDDASEVREVEVAQLVDDPASFVGAHVRVTGNVFFVSECPPPGSGNANCVLLGYLTAPDHRTLIAADVPQAIALAEGGRRLSCAEGSKPTPTCGDWVGAATYTVEGVVERQVLGGRETSLVQLDVSEKSAPQPW